MNSIARRTVLCGLALALGFSFTVSARPLANRTRIEFGAGVRHHPNKMYTHHTWNDYDRFSTATGSVGSITISHWSSEELALTASYSVHDVEYESWHDFYDYELSETSLVHSVMFGLRYYLPQSRPWSTVRPYFSAAMGPFIGTTIYTEEDPCGCEEYSESDHMTVTGARLGGGIDFLVGHRFMIGFNGAYNFVEKFAQPIGGRSDYSGSEFGLSISWLIGRSGR